MMNGQVEVLAADTTVIDSVRYYTDSLPYAAADSVALPLAADSSVIAARYSLTDIYGGSVREISESRAYPKTGPASGTALSVADISVIIVIITVWLLLINRYASETGKIIKGILFPSLIRQVHETTGIHMKSCLRSTFVFTLLLLYAVLVYLARGGYLRVHLLDIDIYLYVLSVLFVFFLARYVLSAFITRMVSDRAFKKVRSYNNIYISATSYALAPLTAMLYMSYGGSVFSFVLLALIASLLAGYYVFVFRIFYSEKLPFKQFFMYLCTVEIIPLAFAVYMIFWE